MKQNLKMDNQVTSLRENLRAAQEELGRKEGQLNEKDVKFLEVRLGLKASPSLHRSPVCWRQIRRTARPRRRP